MKTLHPAFNIKKLKQQLAQLQFDELNPNGTPNGTKEDLEIGCLHSVNNYWVSNEGNKRAPNYHVWVPGITHSTCDSAYADLSCAVARCNYLAKNKAKILLNTNITK